MLNRVTLTGADDSTDIDDLLELSVKFPFVEWGILASGSQQGGNRFPSLKWMADLYDATTDVPGVQLSIHVCGRWVRDICDGNWTPVFTNLGPILTFAERVQLNFHAYTHLLSSEFLPAAVQRAADHGWQIIFQCDGVNDCLVSNAYDDGLDAVPLYDKSGGAGVVPGEWPGAMAGIYSGYAGGLGPDNLAVELPKIAAAANGPHWIDMESRVRSNSDRLFDLKKCRQVLEFCAPLIQPTTASV